MSAIELAQRAAVVAEARSWLDTPYHHEAMIKGVGVDCAMLLIAVFERCGITPHIRPSPYPMDWMLHRDEERYLAIVEQYAHPVAAPGEGDIAVWKFGRTFSHGAIVLQWPLVLHAYRPLRRVTLDDALRGELAQREVKFYSVWGAG